LREVESLLALIREHDTKESDWAFEVGTWASLRAGRTDLAEEYTRHLGDLGEPSRVNHLGALALLAEERGDLDEAARLYWESMQVWRDFYGMYEYGRLSRLRGRLDDAVTWLTRARDDVDQDRLTVLPFSVLVYYQLGLAYEASGWTDKAIDSYRRFLEIWHEADPRPIEMDDARTRLTALENGLG
jgi:tetratricopeptide (TPR) repeat protein